MAILKEKEVIFLNMFNIFLKLFWNFVVILADEVEFQKVRFSKNFHLQSGISVIQHQFLLQILYSLDYIMEEVNNIILISMVLKINDVGFNGGIAFSKVTFLGSLDVSHS